MTRALWSLEVWSVPGGWRFVSAYTTLRRARLVRGGIFRARTRIRKWTPS